MNWDNAKPWADKANEEKQEEFIEPRWDWDCGLKLDFDGGLLRVSSRFCQEHENIFSGTVTFLIGDDELFNREFKCRHIDVLKIDVEKYVESVRNNIWTLCRQNMATFIEPQ